MGAECILWCFKADACCFVTKIREQCHGEDDRDDHESGNLLLLLVLVMCDDSTTTVVVELIN